MRRTTMADVRCSVAQCAEVIGDWWTPLIIRDALMGVRRFSEFQRRLGLSRNILSQRLDALVSNGILDRVRYSVSPERFEYVLTTRGKDLWPIIDAMRRWGDTWAADEGQPVDVIHTTCGHATLPVPTCDRCGERLQLRDLRVFAGAGADATTPLPAR